MKPSCPLCKNKAPLLFITKDFNQEISQDIFKYHRCSSCKLIFIFPIPINLDSYYISTYPAYQMPTLEELDTEAEKERYKVEIVEQYTNKGRLLEIGPSYGGFAYLAKKTGFEVETIEMSPSCCKFLTEVMKITAINTSNVSSALQKLKPYNVIALWHVIEHLADPWEILEVIANKLLPSGILIFAAPNPSALQFRIFGRYWTHVDAPRHLQLIPMQLLIKRMESLGLTTLSATTTDKVSTIFSTFGWWYTSFNNFIKERFPLTRKYNRTSIDHHVEKISNCENRSFSKFWSFTFKLLLFPLRLLKIFIDIIFRFTFGMFLKPIERLEGLGCAYTVIFKKN